MSKKVQKGFTLIELMIVVAIIGILAAIAIPAYQDYIARSQMSEPVSLMSGMKTPLAEFYADRGAFPTALSSVTDTTGGKYTQSITGAATGTGGYTLTATMKATGINKNIQSKTVTLTTTGGTSWTCKAGNVADKYLPGSCR